MRTSSSGIIAGTFIAAMSAALAVPGASVAQDVGTLTAEKATITRAGDRVRAGTGVALGDRFASNASGSGMIVFDDQSSARMGPNAQLTIDEFVYNPSRRNGTIRLRQNAGVARIYGGQISKRGKSELRTPHIVLAVRGGIVDSYVDGDESIVTLRGGIMECRVGNKRRIITNPGYACVSNGTTLEIVRLLDGNPDLLTETTGGQGGQGGRGTYDPAHCTSASSLSSTDCQSRDGGLPRPGIDPGGPQNGGGASGGVQDEYGGDCGGEPCDSPGILVSQ
ncbi:FecR family protein [Oricola sp.]|uniref:FecR family protein n=1 Tax=Oricola sp. TaxID=1979950 RepID=UPI003BACCB42